VPRGSEEKELEAGDVAMSSGPPYFRPTVTAVNCIAEDPGTPVRMELSRIGELIIHNWDEDASNALEALGIDSVCARFVDPTVWQNTLYKIFGLERPDGLPEPLINEILRVYDVIVGTLRLSFKQTLFSQMYKDLNVDIFGVEQDGTERFVEGERLVFASRRLRLGKHHRGAMLGVKTTQGAIINLLSRIPTALVYDPEEDEFGRGDGYWTLAISVIREGDCCDDLVVKAARKTYKQTAFVDEVRTSYALVSNIDDRWIVRGWL
jgi:hypothetical protein